MSLVLMSRVGAAWQSRGITHYLLRVDMPAEQPHKPLHCIIVWANLNRLRRSRPYAVASIDEISRLKVCSREDREYVGSIPLISIDPGGSQPVRNVGQGDIGPFIPHSEDEFLLLLPTPPPQRLPCWPDIVTSLDAIFITQVDDYLEIQTVDANVCALIDKLPSVVQ